MSTVAEPVYTLEQYLTFERDAETKHEYIGGKIRAVPYGNRWHNLTTGNVLYALSRQLRRGTRETYAFQMRLKVEETGLYTYPDVVVTCDIPRFEDAYTDTLLNPAVIVEVLSPATEAYDRGEKFAHYRSVASMSEYVLVTQECVSVDHYLRRGSQWLLTAHESLDDVVALPTLGVDLRLADVYERVAPFEDGAADVRGPAA